MTSKNEWGALPRPIQGVAVVGIVTSRLSPRRALPFGNGKNDWGGKPGALPLAVTARPFRADGLERLRWPRVPFLSTKGAALR